MTPIGGQPIAPFVSAKGAPKRFPPILSTTPLAWSGCFLLPNIRHRLRLAVPWFKRLPTMPFKYS